MTNVLRLQGVIIVTCIWQCREKRILSYTRDSLTFIVANALL